MVNENNEETVEEVSDPEPLVEEENTFQFDDLEQIDIESIPSDARKYVDPILDHVKVLQDNLDSERHAYEEVRNQFQSLMETIDEATKGNIEPIIQEYENVHEAFTQMSTENVDLAYKLFNLEYPEYDEQSDDLKDAFSKALVSERFNERYDGNNLYEKMVDAYKLTLYRKGMPQKPVARKQVEQEAAPAVKKPPSKNAVKQTLVSGGSMAPNMPTINLEEMSYDDILSRGEHLLDL